MLHIGCTILHFYLVFGFDFSVFKKQFYSLRISEMHSLCFYLLDPFLLQLFPHLALMLLPRSPPQLPVLFLGLDPRFCPSSQPHCPSVCAGAWLTCILLCVCCCSLSSLLRTWNLFVCAYMPLCT